MGGFLCCALLCDKPKPTSPVPCHGGGCHPPLGRGGMSDVGPCFFLGGGYDVVHHEGGWVGEVELWLGSGGPQKQDV